MAFQVVSPAIFGQLVGYVAPAQLTQQMPDLGVIDSLFLDQMHTLVADSRT